MQSYSHCTSKGEYIDTFLDKLFTSKTNGVYIELGANNGLIQSNTAFFEFHRGWTGVLIEPSITSYTECVKNRPHSICVHAACVSNEYSEPFIDGDFNGGLMSSVNGARTDSNQLKKCKAITLEKVLDEVWWCAVCCAEGACPGAACAAFVWCARVSAKGASPALRFAALGLAPLLPCHCYSWGLADPFSSVSVQRLAASEWKKNWMRCLVVAAC